MSCVNRYCPCPSCSEDRARLVAKSAVVELIVQYYVVCTMLGIDEETAITMVRAAWTERAPAPRPGGTEDARRQAVAARIMADSIDPEGRQRREARGVHWCRRCGGTIAPPMCAVYVVAHGPYCGETCALAAIPTARREDMRAVHTVAGSSMADIDRAKKGDS